MEFLQEQETAAWVQANKRHEAHSCLFFVIRSVTDRKRLRNLEICLGILQGLEISYPSHCINQYMEAYTHSEHFLSYYMCVHTHKHIFELHTYIQMCDSHGSKKIIKENHRGVSISLPSEKETFWEMINLKLWHQVLHESFWPDALTLRCQASNN